MFRNETCYGQSCRSTWGTTRSARGEGGRLTPLVWGSQGGGGRRDLQVKVKQNVSFFGVRFYWATSHLGPRFILMCRRATLRGWQGELWGEEHPSSHLLDQHVNQTLPLGQHRKHWKHWKHWAAQLSNPLTTGGEGGRDLPALLCLELLQVANPLITTTRICISINFCQHQHRQN